MYLENVCYSPGFRAQLFISEHLCWNAEMRSRGRHAVCTFLAPHHRIPSDWGRQRRETQSWRVTFCSREWSLCGKLSGVSNVVTTCIISSKITKVVLLPPTGWFSCGSDYSCCGSAAPLTWHIGFAKPLGPLQFAGKSSPRLLGAPKPALVINRSVGLDVGVKSC